MEDDQNNYRLIGGDDSKNNEEPSDKETAYLINDCSTHYVIDENSNSFRTNRNNHSESSLINNIVDSYDNDNVTSKLVIGALLFHPIINIIIQDNPTVRKIFTKPQRKLIKNILIVVMLFCLIGFSTTNAPGDNRFVSFILKFLLIVFLLIHTNLFNITNFNATIKLWQKILSKKDK
jgi:hypothetical protein